MSVARDATTTPVPDVTIVRAVRALIAQLLQTVPAHRVVRALNHRSVTAPRRAATVGTRSATALLRVVMVPRLVAMATVVRVDIRSVMVLLRVVMTAARVGADSRSVVVPAVIDQIDNQMIVRGTMTP